MVAGDGAQDNACFRTSAIDRYDLQPDSHSFSRIRIDVNVDFILNETANLARATDPAQENLRFLFAPTARPHIVSSAIT